MSDDLDPDIEDEASGDDPADETVNAADPVAARERRRKIDIDRENAEQFWQRVFADPIGRREMWGILQSAHAFEDRFACGPNGFPQPEATWLQAGEQAFGLRLFFSWQRMDPHGVLQMQLENDHRLARPKPKRKR
jgi:hypothetical protein